MYNTILFDLDGTLTDPGLGITNSVAYALERMNIHVADRTELYKFIGPPLAFSFGRYYGMNTYQSAIAIRHYREYFRDKGIFENAVYPGIPELLGKIKAAGKKVVMATSKPEEFALRILDHYDLSRYFDVRAGATMDETRSEKADVIAYALEQCGNPDKAECIMIGDREHDIIGAKKNGLDSIAVLYGYGNRAEFEAAGATHIVETIDEIFDLL